MSNELHKVFGTGQGSGGSLTFWLAVADVMFQCLKEDLVCFKIQNPTGTIVHKRNEDAFVDDTSLLVDERQGNMVDTLQASSKIHERYLHATGGKLALEKCSCCLV